MIISFGNKKNRVRFSSLFAVSVFLFATLTTSIGAFFPTTTANAQSPTNFEPGIQKLLLKNALATCIGYSALRDDESIVNTRNNINESNAATYKWFSDAPTVVPKATTTLDVFAGVGVNKFGGASGVDGYGRALCSNPAFISSAVAALGYNAPAGDTTAVFQVMCDLGFKRNGGDGCLSGSGSWFLPSGGDAAKNTFLNSTKAKAIPSLTDAQLYWLGYTSFTSLCNATVSPPGGANVTVNAAKIKTYDEATTSMVESTAVFGTNKKSFSLAGSPSDMYTVGIITGNSTNYAPNIVSAGGVLQSSVRIGNHINGCVAFATWVNQFADAYETWRIQNPTFTSTVNELTGCNADEPGCETTSSCLVEGVGWIVCPVTNFLAGISDGAFGVISNFLQINVKFLDTNSGTYTAWTAFRNIANILFVIVFLFIIFSQLTGQGVSNYGIKKTLPRLVVAAVLVNVSFFICQIAVDVTQIIGGSLSDLLKSIPVGGSTEHSNLLWTDVMGDILTGTLVGVGVFAGVVGLTLIVALSVSLPVLLAFLIAVLMTVIILIGRQAGIIILIVLSPLAFIAFLLPNTEQWFKKWYKMFLALLMVYPIIALLYGGGQLTAKIITNVANTTSGADGQMKFWLSIAAIGVAAIPLIMTPYFLKTAMNGMGTIGAKLSGFASKANSRVKSSVNTSSRYGEAKQGIKNRFALGRANRRVNSKLQQKIDQSRLGKALGVDKGATRALAVVQKEESELHQQAKGIIEFDNLSGDARQELATTGQTTYKGKEYKGDDFQKAAIDLQVSGAGAMDEIQQIMVLSGDKTSGVSKFSKTVASSAIKGGVGAKDPSISGKALDDLGQGAFNYEDSVLGGAQSDGTRKGGAIMDGKFTSAAFASMHDKARQRVIDLAVREAGSGNTQYLDALRKAAEGVESTPEVKAKIAGNNVAEEQIATLIGSAPQPSTSSTPATERAFTQEQIQRMTPVNVQGVVEARGGYANMHDGDVLSIANNHAGTEVGRQARQEAVNRNLIAEQPVRDSRTMPVQPTAGNGTVSPDGGITINHNNPPASPNPTNTTPPSTNQPPTNPPSNP